MTAAEPEIVTMRKAMSKYPIADDGEEVSDETQEFKILEKILNNQPLDIEEPTEETTAIEAGLKATGGLSRHSKEEEEREAKKQVLLSRILNKLS